MPKLLDLFWLYPSSELLFYFSPNSCSFFGVNSKCEWGGCKHDREVCSFCFCLGSVRLGYSQTLLHLHVWTFYAKLFGVANPLRMLERKTGWEVCLFSCLDIQSLLLLLFISSFSTQFMLADNFVLWTEWGNWIRKRLLKILICPSVLHLPT